MACSAASDMAGSTAEQVQDDGKIVRSKAPKDIFLAAYFAKAGAVRLDVKDFAKVSSRDKLLQSAHSGMIDEEMAYHQNTLSLTGKLDQAAAIRHREGERFLDEDVLACFQGLASELEMRGGGSGDRDGSVRGGECLVNIFGNANTWGGGRRVGPP